MLLILLSLLSPPPVTDVPPVRAGSWVSPKRLPWDAVYDRVSAGETVWVSVGEDHPDAVRIDHVPPGVGPGVYKCYRENGKNVISQLAKSPVVLSAPAVPVVPFPALIRPTCAGGNCPLSQPLFTTGVTR
jgi:hypothetical protein